MRKTFVSTVMAALLGLAILALAPGASAQGTQVKPYLLFIFDTSGSMVRTTSGAATYGDGSYDFWTGGSSNCCRAPRPTWSAWRKATSSWPTGPTRRPTCPR